MPASWTYTLVDIVALEHILDQESLAGWLEQVFHSIEEKVYKLLGITLNCHIRWLSYIIFEGKAELGWVCCLPLS